MNKVKNILAGIVILTSSILLMSCKKDKNNNNTPPDEVNGCYVQLFDGDNYKDDNIIIKGPGDFGDLSKLPGTDKDWTDEADSFKSGENTTVTFYSEPNFGGTATTYDKGAQKPSVDEPQSIKIACD